MKPAALSSRKNKRPERRGILQNSREKTHRYKTPDSRGVKSSVVKMLTKVKLEKAERRKGSMNEMAAADTKREVKR